MLKNNITQPLLSFFLFVVVGSVITQHDQLLIYSCFRTVRRDEIEQIYSQQKSSSAHSRYIHSYCNLLFSNLLQHSVSNYISSMLTNHPPGALLIFHALLHLYLHNVADSQLSIKSFIPPVFLTIFMVSAPSIACPSSASQLNDLLSISMTPAWLGIKMTVIDGSVMSRRIRANTHITTNHCFVIK